MQDWQNRNVLGSSFKTFFGEVTAHEWHKNIIRAKFSRQAKGSFLSCKLALSVSYSLGDLKLVIEVQNIKKLWLFLGNKFLAKLTEI